MLWFSRSGQRRARPLWALAVLALLPAAAACERPAAPPLLVDRLSLLPGPQAQRIEKALARVQDQGGLTFYIRIRPGTPAGTGEAGEGRADLPGKQDGAAALEIYPLAREFRYRRLGAKQEPFARLPAGWEAKLQEDLLAALPTPKRIGDQIELALRVLDAPADTPAQPEKKIEGEGSEELQEARVSQHLAPSLPAGSSAGDPGAQGDPNGAYLTYLLVARGGNTSTRLALYTPESQALFAKTPITSDQLSRVWEKYGQSPYELVATRDRAVVHFPAKDLTYAPFFILRNPEGWQIDFATVAGAIRVSVSKLWRFSKRDHPYVFAFERDWIDEGGYVHYRPRVIR